MNTYYSAYSTPKGVVIDEDIFYDDKYETLFDKELKAGNTDLCLICTNQFCNALSSHWGYDDKGNPICVACDDYVDKYT